MTTPQPARFRFSLRTLIIAFILLNILLTLFALLYYTFVAGNSRFRAEWEHGLKLPPSARNIQCRGDAWKVRDRVAITLFEADVKEAADFLAGLNKIAEAPLPPGPGYLPFDAPDVSYVIPLGKQQSEFEFYPGAPGQNYHNYIQTWQGTPKPLRVLRCQSPTGDWLNVYEWEVDGHTILLLHTDWN